MAEVDTSSYPKPTVPTSPLDIAGKLGGLQSQSLQINQQKLSQANEALQYLTRAITSIGPNGTPDQYKRAARDVKNAGFPIPDNMIQVWDQKVDSYKGNMPALFDEAISTGKQHSEIFNHYTGQLQRNDNGQRTDIMNVPASPRMPITPRASIPNEIPPTERVLGQDNEPRLQGNQPPPPAQGFNRLGITPPVAPSVLPRPNVNMGPAPVTNKNQAQMPTGPATGLPPGVAEAETQAGGASGQALAQARAKAGDFQAEIFPLTQALPALEGLGTKGTGPGTETINHLKSFVLSNVPGVKESDFNGTVKDFDLANKYLTQFVTTNGNTATNDKLAAAFAGNPSTRISNAAAVDVAKSALALRRMQQAIYQEFETQKLPAHQFSKWVAQRIQQTDPRAFGVDLMTEDKWKKLKASFANQKEADRFEESFNLAKNLGFITPRK